MNMKIGNDFTPPKAVKKMNEVAAGMRRLKGNDENRILGLQVPEHWIYEGAATIGKCPIDSSVISPVFDMDWNVQNMLITLPGGRELLIPHAPLETGFGPLNDGSGTWVCTTNWADGSMLDDVAEHSAAYEGLSRVIKALLDHSTFADCLVGYRTLR